MISLPKRPISVFSLIRLGIFLLILFLGIGLAGRAQAASEAPAPGERLITVHDGDHTKGLLTRSATLREAFNEAHIAIDPRDRIEPGINEVLVARSYDVNIYRARPVMIIDGAVRQKIMSAYQTPAQIAKGAGIELHDEDTAIMTASTDMVSEGAGIQLTITRAMPFSFVLYGKKIAAYTQARTVADMLAKKHITLGKDDTVSVPLTAPITAGMTIEIWRNGKQVVVEEQDVPFQTDKIFDADHDVGYREVRTAGVVGKKTVTFEIEMRDGKEVGRVEIQSFVTKQPSNQIEVVGTKMSNTFSGSFAEALVRLRGCESGGTYTRNSGNGYYGAYQYNISTWANYQGYYLPSDAPPAVQDERAWQTYKARGWQPWPACSRSQGLQDIYR